MKIKSKLLCLLRKPLFYFFVFVLALGYVTPALADYLGPDRTKTITTTSCEVVLLECGFNTGDKRVILFSIKISEAFEQTSEVEENFRCLCPGRGRGNWMEKIFWQDDWY